MSGGAERVKRRAAAREKNLIALLEGLIERFAYHEGKCEDCDAEFRWSASKKAHVPHDPKCLIGRVEKALEEGPA